MKKFSSLVASLVVGSTLTTSAVLARGSFNPAASGSTAAAQQQQFQNDEERKAYEELYAPCFGKEKNDDKCYPLAKAFSEKYPSSQFIKYVKGKADAIEKAKVYADFQKKLEDNYKGTADAAKLDALLAAGEAAQAKFPDDPYIVTQLAMATGNGVLGGQYKDTAKAQALAERALKLLESTASPRKDWPQADWDKFRTEGISRLTLSQGVYQMRQATPNPEQALVYFDKVAANKDWPDAKTPVAYMLRAEANSAIYDKLSAEYRAMTDDDKRSEKGKAALAKVDPVVDAMIDDYARALALSNKNPQWQAYAGDLKPQLENFWKYRYNGKLDGMDEYVKYYEANPTGTTPPKPAAPAAPTSPAAGTKPKG
jgi:hypothetical protein